MPMTKTLCFCLFPLLLLGSPIPSKVWENPFGKKLPRIRQYFLRKQLCKKQYVRFAQAQISFPLVINPTSGLWEIPSPFLPLWKTQVQKALELAIQHKAQVLTFPELTLAVPKKERELILQVMKRLVKTHSMLIIPGSYYAKQRQIIPILTPLGELQAYKNRPSYLEVSPLSGKGMRETSEILLLESDFGNLTVISCIDLLSDSVQYTLRQLSNAQKLDILIVVSYNPAAWEFLLELNSLVRRHPLFATLTNVALATPDTKDQGYSYGHTAVFAPLRRRQSPNSLFALPSSLRPPPLTPYSLAYDHVVASLGIHRRGLLLSTFNLYLKRIPLIPNNPDQGYPPLKNLQFLPLR